MEITMLKERITKAEERIEAKKNTIAKKKKWIAGGKKDEYEIKWLQEDIARLNKEIKETEATVEKYKKQLAGEIENDETILREVPETMKRMQEELVARWDAHDINRRNKMLEMRKQMTYKEFAQHFNKFERQDLFYKNDEQIHKDNTRDARTLILDLYRRIKDITGEVTDWSGIHAEQGSNGFSVLNGYVVGKMGRCRVESILAGGYNIQRLHIRVLTHECK